MLTQKNICYDLHYSIGRYMMNNTVQKLFQDTVSYESEKTVIRRCLPLEIVCKNLACLLSFSVAAKFGKG